MGRALPPAGPRPAALRWWLALVEVRKPRDGVLYAAEVEGAYAWAAAEAADPQAAEARIRGIFAAEHLDVGRLDSLFASDIEEIRGYDRWLATALEGQSAGERSARGALHYFIAEAEA